MLSKKNGHAPDYVLLAIIFIITVAGIAMLASASSDLGKIQFNDTYYYLKHQILYGLSLGVVGFCIGYFWYYQNWKKLAMPLLILCITTLTIVFTRFGAVVNGTNRWLRLGPLSFQPAELAKFIYVVYLAAFWSNTKIKRDTDFRRGLIPFLGVSAVIAILLILQPATSTVAILLFAGAVMYFINGGKILYLLGAGAVAVVLIAAVIYVTPYRRARIEGFLNQSQNGQTVNYQVDQSLIAIGSGGLTGVGYGESATKSGYLPAAIDDSIFAIIAEELGFIGAGAFVVLFCLLGVRLMWLAWNTNDRFGQLLLVGFGAVITLQAFVNMAAISGLIPLTGVPLPFVSYGGTALAIFLTMMGISANVSKYN